MLEYMKALTNKKIYGIIDSICSDIKTDNVLLLATPATINSKFFENKIKEKVNNVYTEGCFEFVPIIEKGYNKDIQCTVDKYIKKYKNKIDTLVLGCTHYILLEKYFRNTLGNDIKIIDASNSTSNILEKEIKDSTQNLEIIMTKKSDIFLEKTKEILNISEKDFIVLYI